MDDKHTERTRERAITKKGYISIFALAAVFGLAGGVWGASIFAARALRISKAQPTTEIVIPATGLLFKTADGKTIAKLINGNEGGSFTIFNKDGQKVAELQSFTEGGSLTLWNDESNVALDMITDSEGGMFALMDSKKGKNIILMGPGDDGGAVNINDSHGDSVVKLGVDRKGGKIETLASELK